MKAASTERGGTGKIFSLDRKYDGRGIVYAFLWDVGSKHPRLFLVPYKQAVAMLPDSSARSASWLDKGRWYSGRPSGELCRQLSVYEDRFDVLLRAKVPEGAG